MPSDPQNLPPCFAELFRLRRETLGLSRERLRLKVGVSAASIKLLEARNRKPSAKLVRRIVGFVPEFAQDWELARSLGEELPPLSVHLPPSAPPTTDSRVTWGVSPTLDPLRIENSPLLSGEASVRTLRRPIFVAKLTRLLRTVVPREPLEVWALGAVNGAYAIDLVQQLLADRAKGSPAPTELCLVDARFPRLHRAAQRATNALGAHPVRLRALLTELDELAVLPGLPTRCGCKRLFVLSGGALGELGGSDTRFLCEGLCEPGDLLALDSVPDVAAHFDPTEPRFPVGWERLADFRSYDSRAALLIFRRGR